jgi:hypothetical protein
VEQAEEREHHSTRAVERGISVLVYVCVDRGRRGATVVVKSGRDNALSLGLVAGMKVPHHPFTLYFGKNQWLLAAIPVFIIL